MIEKVTPTYAKLPLTDLGYNSNGFRTAEFNTVDHSVEKFLTFGCSHTLGASVLKQDIWPEQLKLKIDFPQIFNLGQHGASIDYIHRILPYCLDYFKPNYIFVLCPNFLRFEYTDTNGVIQQSLPTDSNRIDFMESHTEVWCRENYENKLNQIKQLCRDKNIPSFYLTTANLTSVIDHSDRWILASDNSHFDKNWHRIIAEIFRYKFIARHLYI